MKLFNILFIVIVLVCFGCQGNEGGKEIGILDPIFEGKGNLRYDPLTESLLFDGYKDGYFLNVEGQVKMELIKYDEPGQFKLKYPGNYKISLLNVDTPVGRPLIFHKGVNYGSNFFYNTNLDAHGFEEPLYGTLNDGLSGSIDPRDGQWWCWKNQNAAIVIDLGDKKFIEKISFRYYEDIDQKIYPPTNISISGSYDGQKYTPFFIRNSIQTSNIYYKKIEAVVNNDFRYYRFDLFAQSTDQSETAKESYLLLDEIFLTEGTPTFMDQK